MTTAMLPGLCPDLPVHPPHPPWPPARLSLPAAFFGHLPGRLSHPSAPHQLAILPLPTLHMWPHSVLCCCLGSLSSRLLPALDSCIPRPNLPSGPVPCCGYRAPLPSKLSTQEKKHWLVLLFAKTGNPFTTNYFKDRKCLRPGS